MRAAGAAAARAGNLSVAGLADEWLLTRRGRVAPGTLEYDETQLKRIKPVLGAVRVQALTVGDVRRLLADRYMVDYDETQAIGRRYRRQDESGTPLCVTIDFDSLDDGAVTLRDRDTTEHVRVKIPELLAVVCERLGF